MHIIHCVKVTVLRLQIACIIITFLDQLYKALELRNYY